jgi:Ni/Co efflux regulator RcnB
MITAALALCLIGGAAAAQDRDHGRGGEGRQGGGEQHHGGGPQGGGHEGRGAPQGAPQGGPAQTHGFRAGPQGAPQAQAPAPQFGGGGERRGGAAPGFQGAQDRRDGFRGGEFRGAPAPGPGFRGEVDRRGAEPGYRPGLYLRDHGWRGAGRTFRVAPYRYPAGWTYRHWAFGAFLPFVFLATDYTLYDYWVYGLPVPPPGYHWIRVGPDALLVRYGDGYVLDAVYGIFFF